MVNICECACVLLTIKTAWLSIYDEINNLKFPSSLVIEERILGKRTMEQQDPMQLILQRLDQQQKMIEDIRAEQVRQNQDVAALTAMVGQSQPRETTVGGATVDPPPNGQPGLINSESIQQWMDRFQKYSPPAFNGTLDVQVAEDWVDQLEKIFAVLECPSVRKARMAIFKLEKDAHRWWRNTELMLQARGTPITWEVFKEQFQEKYFPQSVRDAKEVEFLQLKQGDKEPFDEYLAKYMRLSNYSTYLRRMEDEEWSTKRLVEGLNGVMKERMVPQRYTRFNEAVEVCRLVERSMNHQAISHTSAKREEAPGWNTMGGSSKEAGGNRKRKKQQFNKEADRANDRDGEQVCKTCGRSHGKRPCWAEQGSCYICGEKGHFAKMCPQKADNSRPKTTGRVFALPHSGITIHPKADQRNHQDED